MAAVDQQGFTTSGHLLALNSYENRVYQVGIEDGSPLIAKFYRPDRWSREQIQEEHDFCFELAEQELSVVTPLCNDQHQSLFFDGQFMFALYPRQGGHAPDFSNPDHLEIMGRLLARLHNTGARHPFRCRPRLDSQQFGHEACALISTHFIPPDLKPAYDSLTKDLLRRIDDKLGQLPDVRILRTHGDCHAGNILWRDDIPHMVDLDDARNAPAIQDIWMLLSGDRQEQQAQLREILSGYQDFRDFDYRELLLVEVFRTLRIIHYAAWIASRWQDPAFPKTFTWFNTPRYWSEHILELREQQAALLESPLSVF